MWLVVHLYYLIGFENRLLVMLRWSWYYVRYDRPVRAIIRAHPPRTERLSDRECRVRGGLTRTVRTTDTVSNDREAAAHGHRRDDRRELRSRPSRRTTPCWSTSGHPGAARAGSSRPVFEKAAETHSDLVFAKVDTEAQQELAGAFGIQSIPTLMVFRENVVVFSQPGALPEAALEDLIGQVRALDMERCTPRSPSTTPSTRTTPVTPPALTRSAVVAARQRRSP